MPFCSPYYNVTLPACPDSIVIDGGLQPGSQHRWEIKDKFGIVYSGTSQTDGNGKFYIDVAGNTSLPKGLFMEFSGVFTLRIFPYNSTSRLPEAFTIEGEEYTAIQLRFKKYIGDSGTVYVPTPVPTTPTNIIVDGSAGQDTAVVPAGSKVTRVVLQAPSGNSVLAGTTPGGNDFFILSTGPDNTAEVTKNQAFPNQTTLYFTGVTEQTTITLFTVPMTTVTSYNDLSDKPFSVDEVAKLKQILNIDNTDQ